MRLRHMLCGLAAGFVLTAPLTPTHAAQIRIDFSGQVTNHGGDMVAALPLGTAGSGYFIYDTDAPATGGGSDNTRYNGALLAYGFTVGSYHYSTGTETVAWVFDESPLGDRFDLGDYAGVGDTIAGHPLTLWGLMIGRAADGAVQGTALPGVGWYTPASGLVGTLLVQHGAWADDHRYQVQLTTLSFTTVPSSTDPDAPDTGEPVHAVPEPHGLALVLAGLCALWTARRSRRQRP